jgi:EpsI family protein
LTSRLVAAWLAGLAMLACAAAAHTLKPVPAPRIAFDLSQAVPVAFGDWRVDPSIVPIAPTPDVQASLDKIYDQIVSRAYVNSRGERVMLVIGYGGDQSDSLKAHRQEVCYAAQGFAIREVRNDRLTIGGTASVPLVRMHAQKARRSEPVTYWFTMGDRVAIGRTERLALQIGHGLAGRVPDGLLLRVSSLSPDTAASYAEHDRFLRELLQAVDPQVRTRLAGTGAAAPAS